MCHTKREADRVRKGAGSATAWLCRGNLAEVTWRASRSAARRSAGSRSLVELRALAVCPPAEGCAPARASRGPRSLSVWSGGGVGRRHPPRSKLPASSSAFPGRSGEPRLRAIPSDLSMNFRYQSRRRSFLLSHVGVAQIEHCLPAASVPAAVDDLPKHRHGGVVLAWFTTRDARKRSPDAFSSALTRAGP